MSYAWTENSESRRAEKIPKGKHAVRILKIVRQKEGGEQFCSNSGDPQLMVVFQDSQAREISDMFTLSERAAFRLAQMLAVCDPPVNLQQMEADGVEPYHFADEGWATQMLCNRKLTIEVIPNPQDERYPNVGYVKVRGPESAPSSPKPVPAAPSPPAAQSAPPAPAAADRASYLPPMPPPPASAQDDGPPPVDTAPRFASKHEAWQHVLNQWANRATDDAGKSERNNAWASAVREVAAGRQETQLTAADWSRVASLCEVPF